MENLLPVLASIDVTSNQFRETTLPYQQWETKRTHYTPTTPSDVGHLLPPIGGRKPRRDSSSSLPPVPPYVEPSLPRPAPVDRNLLDLYDPALNPSPIGKEERGKVQPVRISRIVPRQGSLLRAQDLQGAGPSKEECYIPTVVTVLNGYRAQHVDDRDTAASGDWASADAASDDEEHFVDIFIQGFSKGFDHTTLLPSEILCRALQNGGQRPPNPSSMISGDVLHSLNVSGGYLGLTVCLAGTGDWFDTVDGDIRGRQNEGRIETDIGEADGDSIKNAVETVITRTIFQREDGMSAPSCNAFRLQFEPGPLGLELEEYPGQRGIVQVRRVLQGGQAERDGRLSAGCLIVAVGDWAELSATGPPPSNSATADVGAVGAAVDAVDIYGTLDVSALRSSAINGGSGARRQKSVMIRSLAELDKAISCRESDRLFVLWALDREAPEAIAALGDPRTSGAYNVPHAWPPAESLYSRRKNEGAGRPEGVCVPGCEGQRPFDPWDTQTSLRSKEFRHRPEGALLEGAPGWEAGTGFARRVGSLEYSLSSNEPGVFDRNLATRMAGASLLRENGGHSETDPGFSAFGSTRETTGGSTLSTSGGKHRLGWPGRGSKGDGHRLEEGGAGSAGGWEFETGGGIFDEDDQGIAARKQPASSQASLAEAAAPLADGAENEPPPLPLGLQASAVDELAVFIWFCNNHESAVMKVSWIDYEGKRVPRRSLEPGGCYFERSFATHPWVIQHSSSNRCGRANNLHVGGQQEEEDAPIDRGTSPLHPRVPQALPQALPREAGEDDGAECCVVRLGNAMALAPFTGSLIWNPTRRTLSVTKQAKVGVPGMSAAAHAAVGADAADGAGLDPGKKRLFMVGPQREAAEGREKAARAVARGEKARILQEMKSWRTHPHDGVKAGASGVGGGVVEGVGGGLGQGVPHLRVVMIGSSSWNE